MILLRIIEFSDKMQTVFRNGHGADFVWKPMPVDAAFRATI